MPWRKYLCEFPNNSASKSLGKREHTCQAWWLPGRDLILLLHQIFSDSKFWMLQLPGLILVGVFEVHWLLIQECSVWTFSSAIDWVLTS